MPNKKRLRLAQSERASKPLASDDRIDLRDYGVGVSVGVAVAVGVSVAAAVVLVGPPVLVAVPEPETLITTETELPKNLA